VNHTPGFSIFVMRIFYDILDGRFEAEVQLAPIKNEEFILQNYIWVGSWVRWVRRDLPELVYFLIFYF